MELKPDELLRREPEEGPGEELFHLEGLVVNFGSGPVLKQIDLKIRRGETVCIVGESGCGKTVLLKTMISLIRPTAGRILFDGKDLNALSRADLVATRTRFGFVFQMAALFDSMTILENVAFPIREHTAKSDEEVREIVEKRLAEVGLSTSVLHKKPAELSGGMRKRVGLARALAMDPEVLFYDEPTTGLDPIMSDVINELILRTKRQHNVTSVIITHDMKTVRKVASRVVMLYPISRLNLGEGQILFDGPPSQLESYYDVRVRQFVAGDAGDRLMEFVQQQEAAKAAPPSSSALKKPKPKR